MTALELRIAKAMAWDDGEDWDKLSGPVQSGYERHACLSVALVLQATVDTLLRHSAKKASPLLKSPSPVAVFEAVESGGCAPPILASK